MAEMQFYLVRLSYKEEGWRKLIDSDSATPEDRLKPVVDLVSHLGGGFPVFNFYSDPFTPSDQKAGPIVCKFVPIGEHDVVTMLALPDNKSARAFHMAVASQAEVKSVEMTALIPFAEAHDAMRQAKDALDATGYRAVGQYGKA